MAATYVAEQLPCRAMPVPPHLWIQTDRRARSVPSPVVILVPAIGKPRCRQGWQRAKKSCPLAAGRRCTSRLTLHE